MESSRDNRVAQSRREKTLRFSLSVPATRLIIVSLVIIFPTDAHKETCEVEGGLVGLIAKPPTPGILSHTETQKADRCVHFISLIAAISSGWIKRQENEVSGGQKPRVRFDAS